MIAASLALAGCTGGSTAKPDTQSGPSAEASAPASALAGLRPAVPSKLTAASAKKATTAVADAIVGLIDKADVIYVDDHSEVVPATKTAAATYGILRTVNITSTIDPVDQAKAMVAVLQESGWTVKESSVAAARYLVALTSSSDPKKAWFVLIGGDATVAKQSVVTVQLASPDLPKSTG